MNPKYYYLIFTIILGSIGKLYPQCSNLVVLQNPSFEGTPGNNVSPPSWTSCIPGWGPNTLPYTDSSSGATFASPLLAYEGNTYLGLAFNSSQGAQAVSQQLSTSFQAGVSYTSSVELAVPTLLIRCFDNKEESISAEQGCAGIYIYGGNSFCDLAQLLWTSGEVTDSSWQNYPISFTPVSNCNYLTILIYDTCVASICNSNNISYIFVDTIAPFVANLNVTAAVNQNNLCAYDSSGQATASVISNLHGLSYQWSSVPSQTDSVLSHVTAGTYTVTVSGGGSLCATASVSINAPPALTVNITHSVTCSTAATGSATAGATGGMGPYRYNWSNGDTGTDVENLSSGTYKVTLTDSHQCTATSSVTIDSSAALSVTIQSRNTSCGGDTGYATVVIRSGNGPFTYLWSNNSADSSIQNLAAGSYKVTVSTSSGCSATDSTNITSSGGGSPFTITSNKTIMCSSDSAYVCAPVGYSSYVWNTGDSTPCIYVQSAGNYYLIATDSNNCTASSNHLAINVYPLPPVLISASGDTLTSYDAVTYQWYLNGIAIPEGTSDKYIAIESGSYTVLISDTNSCTETSSPYFLTLAGIEELNKNEWVKVYPNPSNGANWQLDIGNSLLGSIVEIFDAHGGLLYKSKITNSKAQIELDVPGGVYLMRISSMYKSVNLKLVKL